MQLRFFCLFAAIPLFGMRPSAPLKCSQALRACPFVSIAATNVKKVIFPEHLYRTIFPGFLAQIPYDGIPYYRSVHHLEKIAKDTMNPHFLNESKIEEFAHEVNQYRPLQSNFLSYALYLAVKWQPVKDESINQKYALLVKRILDYSFNRIENDPVWNQNAMWLCESLHRYPLNISLKFDLEKIVTTLLDRKHIELNIKNDFEGHAPLHLASKEIAQLLIDKGANLNIQDNDGNTPLHRCSPEITSKLLEREADITIKNNEETSLFSFNTNKWIEVIGKNRFEQLCDYKVQLDRENLFVCHDSHKALITTRIGYQGMPPLFKAFEHGDVKKAKILIDHLKANKADKFQKQLKSARLMVHLVKQMQKELPYIFSQKQLSSFERDGLDCWTPFTKTIIEKRNEIETLLELEND